MQKPLSEKKLRSMIKDWQVCVYAGEFNDETDALLDLCKYVEESHGIMAEELKTTEETPKEQSKDPVQLELNMWL